MKADDQVEASSDNQRILASYKKSRASAMIDVFVRAIRGAVKAERRHDREVDLGWSEGMLVLNSSMAHEAAQAKTAKIQSYSVN